MSVAINPAHAWFNKVRYGMFIHWGPYAVVGRGEQSLNREWLDHNEYAEMACAWNPVHYNPQEWIDIAVRGGMKYAVLTTRHHDGYCLWDTKTTDYSSTCQAPKRDLVAPYVEACRKAGLKVGLYYSLLDFRLPGWLRGPDADPEGFARDKQYIFDQVRELLTNYGKIDMFWFDGIWPRSAKELDSVALIAMMRELQPEIIINDRLEYPQYSYYWQFANWREQYKGDFLGDFGTPEQGIYNDSNFIWESCQTSVSRLWGYTIGEQWRPDFEILRILVECASRGGNFLLNVGPDAEGRFPHEFVTRTNAIGDWLKLHGEAIYETQAGNITEFITYGYQTTKEENLYLIIRFWDGRPTLRLRGLKNRVKRAVLLSTGKELAVRQADGVLYLDGLPQLRPTALFPVIRVECEGSPEADVWGKTRTWQPNAEQFARWAEVRGTSVWRDGKLR
ncbi:MAG: alpha-L-fucosidase [Lentisphaerae bacterium]|jgi:alpha-L-fucosidase|nr:alpha-L-fucosidase [Lentisphaerota bacterium]